MSVIGDIFDEATSKVNVIAIVVGLAIGAALFMYVLHLKGEADKVPGLEQANENLAAAAARDDKAQAGLNADRAGAQANNTKNQGAADADIKQNPTSYACAVPIVSVRLINSAVTASTR
jgi:hypothetical protein